MSETTSRADVPEGVSPEVAAMLTRANRLGSDPMVTNYGGGNSSCTASTTHPANGSLARTTGLLVPVDSGVPQAFPR